MRKLLFLGLASFAALVIGSANAADIQRPVLKAAPPPPPPAYNWTGFYVGAHLGGGWARQAWEERSNFGNGFGQICHSPPDDGEVQPTDLNEFGDLFPICP